MTLRLKAALEDLASQAPPAQDRAAQWSAAGRARRLRRRFGLAVLTLVALVLVIPATVSPLRTESPPAPGSGGAGIDGYPQRIGFERSPQPMPDAPGPLAAIFWNNDFGNGFYVGVSSAGQLWRVGIDPPVLSHDGTQLLVAEPTVFEEGKSLPDPAVLTLHDLVSGDRRSYDHIKAGTATTTADPAIRFQVKVDRQVHWSPDNSRVLLLARERPRRSPFGPRVLDVATGELTEVADGEPAGFRSPEEAVTVRKLGGSTAADGVAATTTDLRTGESETVALQLDRPWRGDKDGSLSASVSGDGSTLLLVETPDRGSESALRLFSLSDGRELPARAVRHVAACASTWLGNDPVVAVKEEGSQVTSVLVTREAARRMVAIHPRSQSFCIEWASDALAGGSGWSLFGTATAWWTWYWYLAIALLGLPLAGIGLSVLRRRRRS